ncbi:MAG: Lysophospholipid transporter LplT [Betaproteobacteria bacterium ADurb.Bin341]|nr:MAG: Lysophospholipid transporter LplT [Betaproteobacteria bacterium ADurb.Bin341]
MSKQFALFKTRRFAPLFGTQFLGAFNDNLYKNALVVLLTFQAAKWTSMKPEILANLAAGIFILPFFLFSATAGQLADKYDKAWLARFSKVLEIVIMLLAAAGFCFVNLTLLLLALFLLGAQSTLFGPVKYAILPQHLHEDELVGGNALVEAGTFVAILVGTLAGGLLAGSVGHPAWIAVGGMVVAVLGYLASRGIPVAPAPDPGLRVNPNPLTETWRCIGYTRQNRTVFLSILGISWFWLYGALFLAQFPAYARQVLGGTESSVTLLLAVFTVGIGLGSLLCERLSGKHVEMGLVPFGSIGLSIFAVDLALASPLMLPPGAPLGLSALLAMPAIWRVLLDLLLLGVFGGFFIVPLYALMQVYSAEATRARTIAANNILNALFMVIGALAAAGILALGASIATLFLIAAIANALVALYIYGLLPEFLQRFIVWMIMHTATKLETEGVEQNVPEQGPAILLFDQATPARILAMMAACRRPARFVVAAELLKKPLLGFVLRQSRAIVLPSLQDEVLADKAREEIVAALKAGGLLGMTATALAESGLPQIPGLALVPLVRLELREAESGGVLAGLFGALFQSRFPAGISLGASSLPGPLSSFQE